MFTTTTLMPLLPFVVINNLILRVSADWQYKSRPDLSPPTLNITISATSEVSTGLIFVAPYSGVNWDLPLSQGPLQPGPYIFTSAGELVWSGFGYITGFVANFQAAKWKDQDVLFALEASRNNKHGHGHGHGKILNQNYETIKEVRGGNGALLDIHEFHIVDEKTTLVESYKPIPFELKKYGTESKSQWIVEAVFQEIEINTGRLLFQWNSLDHVHPDGNKESARKRRQFFADGKTESVAPISSLKFGTGYNSSDALDYFHINSVDRDDEHNYLVSGRHTSTIYKINGTSGDIIWRLGGKNSDFELGRGVDFGLQHHARFISRSKTGEIETISLFDNSGPQIDGKSGEYINKSSGKLISLDTESWTATLVQDFPAPDNIFAFSQGGTQVLPNGNVFVNWGSGGAITEFSPNGTVIFHAYLESGELWANGDVQNYRGFRFNWTGVPSEEPAIVALAHGQSTMVYVSWNGDTETKFWQFYGVDSKGREILLGRKQRNGFETSFYVWSGEDWRAFFAEAEGKYGKVSRRTKSASIEPYIYPYVPGRDDLLLVESAQVLLRG